MKPYISSVDGMWRVLDADGVERYQSTSLNDAQNILDENWEFLANPDFDEDEYFEDDLLDNE